MGTTQAAISKHPFDKKGNSMARGKSRKVGIGHNSGVVEASDLKNFVKRLEYLDNEIAERRADKAQVLKDAKGKGYEPRIINMALKKRREEARKKPEIVDMLETYMGALSDLPLFAAAGD